MPGIQAEFSRAADTCSYIVCSVDYGMRRAEQSHRPRNAGTLSNQTCVYKSGCLDVQYAKESRFVGGRGGHKQGWDG
jgi:hypothetical protein